MVSLNDEVEARRLAQIERRLIELGSITRGYITFTGDRISDVLDHVDELQRQITGMQERMDRMAEFLTKLKHERNHGSDQNAE